MKTVSFLAKRRRRATIVTTPRPKPKATPMTMPTTKIMRAAAFLPFFLFCAFSASADSSDSPAVADSSSSPLVVVIDNGWASSLSWPQREARLELWRARARREAMQTAVIATADFPSAPTERGSSSPTPRAATPDRAAAAARLDALSAADRVVWIADGLDYGSGARFASALNRLAGEETPLHVEIFNDRPQALGPPQADARGFTIPIHRPAPRRGRDSGAVIGYDGDDAALMAASYRFDAAARRAEARFDVPAALANRLRRLTVYAAPQGRRERAAEESAATPEGAALQTPQAATAAAHQFLGDDWRRVAVGVIGEGESRRHPLLSPTWHLRAALGETGRFFPTDDAARIVAAADRDAVRLWSAVDGATVPDAARDAMRRSLEKGAILLQFAAASVETPLALPPEDETAAPSPEGAAAGEAATPGIRFAPDGLFADLAAAGMGFAPLDGMGSAPLDGAGSAPPDGMGFAPPDGATGVAPFPLEGVDVASMRVWARDENGAPFIVAYPVGSGWLARIAAPATPQGWNGPWSASFAAMMRRLAASADPPTPTASRISDAYGVLSSPVGAVDLAATHEVPGLHRRGEGVEGVSIFGSESQLRSFDFALLPNARLVVEPEGDRR